MSRIFISHSSLDADWAVRVRDWLAANGWMDVFLDLDPERGIKAGERWKSALQKAAHRCEMVLALVSNDWIASQWCKGEVIAARLMNKKVIVALIGTTQGDLPPDFHDDQWVDLANDSQGFARLRHGLTSAGLDPSSFTFEDGRRPYPGFAALEEKDAAIFFGREAQIVRGLDKLRGMAQARVDKMMIVLGASGAGKSSFLRAGLWPRLHRDDHAWLPLPTIRPERAVISGKLGLAQSIHAVLATPHVAERLKGRGLPETRADVEEFVTKREDGLAVLLASMREASGAASNVASGASPPTIVLVIDQAEELLNDDGRAEAQTFIEIVTRTLAASDHVLALVAIRSDSFPQFQLDPRLAACPKDTFTLDMMLQGSYAAVIEGPAAVARPAVKIDANLTNALLKDISGQDALPLLAFTLAHLYDRYRTGNELKLSGYTALGGLRGIIEKAVEQAFGDGIGRGEVPRDRAQQLALIRRCFIPHLAGVNASGQFVRRIALRSEIQADAHKLLDCLVRAHLVISDRRVVDGAEQEVIEVAHEALLREWGDLHRELQAEAGFLKWTERVKDEHYEWQKAEGKQKDDHLLSGSKLDEALAWQKSKGSLEPALGAYIGASKRHRRRLQMALGSLPIVGAVLYYAIFVALRFVTDVQNYFTFGEPLENSDIVGASAVGIGASLVVLACTIYLLTLLRRALR